jgi:hypothetical protein
VDLVAGHRWGNRFLQLHKDRTQALLASAPVEGFVV